MKLENCGAQIQGMYSFFIILARVSLCLTEQTLRKLDSICIQIIFYNNILKSNLTQMRTLFSLIYRKNGRHPFAD